MTLVHTIAYLRCLRLFETQHGVISVAQALEQGLSRGVIYRLVERGEWIIVFPGVLALRGTPDTPLKSLKAAELAGGRRAAICGISAAALHGLDGFDHGVRPEVVTTGRLRQPRIRCHRTRKLRSADIVRRHGIRVTSIDRTLIDLAARLSKVRLEQALDSALVMGLTAVPHLWRYLNRLGGRGRHGVRVLRMLLIERLGPRLPHRTLLEIKLKNLLQDRLPYELKKQFRILENGTIIARLDFAIPALKIGLEGQSHRHHSSKTARRNDARKLNALQRLGWIVLWFYWEDVHLDPDYVIDEVMRTIEAVLDRRTSAGAALA